MIRTNTSRRKLLAAVALAPLLCLAVSSLPAQEPGAENIKLDLGDLNVELTFPGKAREKKLENGKSVSLAALGGKANYFFQHTVLPNKVDALGDKAVAKKILDSGREGLLRNLEGSKILSEKDYLHQGKYPARDIRAEAPGIGIYRTQVILTPAHLFQMIVAGPAGFTDAAPAKTFLDSFKINN